MSDIKLEDIAQERWGEDEPFYASVDRAGAPMFRTLDHMRSDVANAAPEMLALLLDERMHGDGHDVTAWHEMRLELIARLRAEVERE